ncbi:MAG: aminopeptidase [Bacteroidota bacterium]
MASSLRMKKAAVIALKDYLGLSEYETLLVITDEEKREIGMTLFEESKALCAESIYLEMKSRTINGEEPPPPVANIMKEVDAVICPTSKSLTHTNARREASKLGVRVATMPGITVDTMIRCLSADHEQIMKLTHFLADKMRQISKIRVTTKLGTDITFPMKGRQVIPSTGVLRNIGESGNLPSGEVYLAPIEDKSQGKLIIDGSMGSIGIVDEHIVVDVVDGYAKSISGGAEAKMLEKLLDDAGKDGRAVAEFGIGTNYKARVTGDILEDEKVLGTIHVAFGNNLSMGGKIAVNIHLDGIVRRPTVYFDDEVIMEEGRIILEWDI